VQIPSFLVFYIMRMLFVVFLFSLAPVLFAEVPGSADPPGLYVQNGTLMKAGKPYRGVGANYFSLFQRMIKDPEDSSSLTGLKALSDAHIPFVRFMCCGFWPADLKLYQANRAAYFERLDKVVRCAEENHIGLIPSLFWHVSTVPDVMGEHMDQLGNPESRSIAFILTYTSEVVQRYKNSSAIWGWEFGNEYNLAVDLPNSSQHRPRCVPVLGTPGQRTEQDELKFSHVRTAFVSFAETVRKYDPNRIIISGNAAPRPSAWHNLHERSWGQDTEEQFAEILLRDNPDPINTISVHIYPEPNHAYFGATHNINDAVGMASKHARKAGKPLFMGEFGASEKQLAKGGNPRAAVDEFLQAIIQHDVPLAAFWVFDLPMQEKDCNITFQNSRAYVLEMVIQLNAMRNHLP